MDSLVHYYGIQSSRCGYCKGTKCSKSYGMHAYTLSPDDYQNLINRGWRRSGQYCYKPHNQSTCCPSYTIKCDALEFKLSKSHKKILKRMTRFLRDGKKDKCDDDDEKHGGFRSDDKGSDIQDEPKAPKVPLPHIDLESCNVSNVNIKQNLNAKKVCKGGNVQNLGYECTIDQPESSQRGLKQQASDNFSKDPPCKKAKQIRLERRQAKLLAKGITEMPMKSKKAPTEKTLTDYIASDVSPDDKHKLKLVLVPSRPIKVEKHVHALYRKYQIIVHNDAPDRVTPTNLERFLYKSPLQLKLVSVRNKEFSATLEHSYAVYKKYQTKIHNDPPDEMDDYLNFLVDTPLKYNNPPDGPPLGYGSFHQQYWLDEKLIAVGVIDILPQCLSSVYFFYDPDYSFLSLGTYASLREIEFVKQLSQMTPELKYYYMGFYIHSCPKMRYKGKLVPSQLLCSEAYTWHLLTDEIRAKLDERKYQRFNPDPNAKDADDFEPNDMKDVVIYSENKICPYWEYVQQSLEMGTMKRFLHKVMKAQIHGEMTGDENERELLLEYGRLIGKTSAHRIVYVKD